MTSLPNFFSTLMAISSSGPAVRLHSLTCPKAKTKNLRVLHIIRHAEGFHNISKDYKNPANIDAQLTPHGISQCKELSQRIQEDKLHVDSIISSPMRRALQTAHHSFEHIFDCQLRRKSTPFVACEHWRETVNYVCDVRLPLSQLSNDFPSVDFKKIIHEHDPIWKFYEEKHGSLQEYQKIRESSDDEGLEKRARKAWQTIAERPESEKSIAIVSHSAFFMHMFTRPELGVVSYEDADVEQFMNPGFENCEMRSVAFEII
mmetsp:Transcript_27223/g.40312  ORF Transcript_27223/g.40312 Transcript_27223/m.40312 type:complete len:260 (-) Transcript_27223:43-822(-)